jgi:hypothetical protein
MSTFNILYARGAHELWGGRAGPATAAGPAADAMMKGGSLDGPVMAGDVTEREDDHVVK